VRKTAKKSSWDAASPAEKGNTTEVGEEERFRAERADHEPDRSAEAICPQNMARGQGEKPNLGGEGGGRGLLA